MALLLPKSFHLGRAWRHNLKHGPVAIRHCWWGSVFLFRVLFLTNVCWVLAMDITPMISAINTCTSNVLMSEGWIWPLSTCHGPKKCPEQGHGNKPVTFQTPNLSHQALPGDPAGSTLLKKSGDTTFQAQDLPPYPSRPSRAPCGPQAVSWANDEQRQWRAQVCLSTGSLDEEAGKIMKAHTALSWNHRFNS